jgi:hypothetical protein
MKRQRYRIKSGFESFDITDGPDSGRRFMRGMTYTELPAGFEARFEPVPEATSKKKSGKGKKYK